MAGRGRGGTLPSWMTQAPGSGAPGSSTAAVDALAASNPNAASNPPATAEAGQPVRAISSTIKALHCVCLTVRVRTGPVYTSDVVEAAQAQVLQEQDVAMQHAIAASRYTCNLF